MSVRLETQRAMTSCDGRQPPGKMTVLAKLLAALSGS